MLRDEDESQIEQFLATHDDFTLVPAAPVWRASIGQKYPGREPMLRLSPARHGTDGFFVAVLERKPALAPEAAAAEDAEA
jgi:16S rRNA (cytosine967-C5)-methyltransferase